MVLQESNQGHKDFQSFALPTELRHQLHNCGCKYKGFLHSKIKLIFSFVPLPLKLKMNLVLDVGKVTQNGCFQ